MNRVRRRLQNERGIATWPQKNVGYQLLTVRQTIEDLPKWRHQRAMRQEKRGLKSVRALPDDDLTPHQRRAKQFQIDAIRQANAEIRAWAAKAVAAARNWSITPN